MQYRLSHPLGWSVFSFAAAALCLLAGGPAPGQGDKELPIIEKFTHKSYTEKIPGTRVQFDMVAIPGGTYMMGGSKNEPGHQPDESPKHPVTIRPLWVGKMEVTWDEYDLYWRKLPGAKPPETPADKVADAVTKPTNPYADETFGHGREGNPVLCITYHAAMQYCRWLSAKTGKLYRLPTEAEWEWACRAGTTTAYSFGDDVKKLPDYAWFTDNSEEVAHKVGQKKPNPWGLYDMHGNVAEWCVDHYVKDAYKKFPLDRPIVEPVIMPTDKRYSYVARGGSWTDKADKLRSAARRGSEKDWLRRDPQRPQSIWWMTDADFVGFRVVRPVEEVESLKGLQSKITRQSPD